MLKFDTAYYKRFYGDNGAHDAEKVAHLATAVHHLAALQFTILLHGGKSTSLQFLM